MSTTRNTSSSGDLRSSSTCSFIDIENHISAQYEGESADQQQNNGLLRTITQYTEYSVNTGAALEHKIIEDEKKKKGEKVPAPTNTYSILSKEFYQPRFIKQYVVIILILIVFLLSVFSIYWGALYQKQKRLVNLKVLVVLEDDASGILSQAINQTAHKSPVSKLAGWSIHQGLTEEEIVHKVYQQDYWGAIYIPQQNSSASLESAFANGEFFNTTGVVRAYYETGRDPNGMNSYVTPAIKQFSIAYQSLLAGKVYPELISNMSNDQLGKLRDSQMLSAIPEIQLADAIPLSDPVLMAPLQVGLIFIIILTFFQVMWFMKLHGEIARVLNPLSYIAYRMIVIQITCLLLSLSVTVLNSAFQVRYNKSWSGGFGVAWMIFYLCMSAVGGANENVGLICFAVLPPTMGFWLLFFVVSNIAGTFTPIETCAKIFRFTYAMPVKNAYELLKILFFDTTRRHLGRYIGILVAWIVLNNLLLPFCLMFYARITKKNIERAAKEAEEARGEENDN